VNSQDVMLCYLDDESGLVALAGAPEDDGEECEKHEKEEEEAEVQAEVAGGAVEVVAVIGVVVVIGVVLGVGVELLPVGRKVARVFEGGGEAGSGGFSRVVNGGREVVEMVVR